MGPTSFASGRPRSSQTTLTWTERGPNSVGGRTRAFAIDVSNPSVLVAGGVARGMWSRATTAPRGRSRPRPPSFMA
jgi:hypothetical protein